MFFRQAINAKPVVDFSRKNFSNFFENQTNKPLKMIWIKQAPPQRVLIEGHKDFLESYSNNLAKEGIPSVSVTLPNGEKAIEVWYNESTFAQKLDEVAGKTVEKSNVNVKV